MTKYVSAIFISTVLIINLPGVGASVVHFRMDVSDSTILVGQQSVISVYAYVENVPSGEGIISWGLDLILESEEDGIVQVENDGVSIINESFYDVSGGWVINDPYTGMVQGLGAINFDYPPSDIGVGLGEPGNIYDLDNYTLIATVTIVGLSQGSVTYSIGGLGFFAELTNEPDPSEEFRSDFSAVQVNVLPEPATGLLLAIPAIGLLRKRRIVCC